MTPFLLASAHNVPRLCESLGYFEPESSPQRQFGKPRLQPSPAAPSRGDAAQPAREVAQIGFVSHA